MKSLLFFALLFLAATLFAQDSNSNSPKSHGKSSKDEVTLQGCVSRSNGDYILMKQDPGVAYELQPTGKMRLRHYLGKQVEITAHSEPTLSSSSDALNKVGSAAPVTLAIISIRTISSHCYEGGVPR